MNVHGVRLIPEDACCGLLRLAELNRNWPCLGMCCALSQDPCLPKAVVTAALGVVDFFTYDHMIEEFNIDGLCRFPELARDLDISATWRWVSAMITTDSQFSLVSWPRRASATVYNNTTHDYWYALEPTSYTPAASPPTGDVFTQPNYNHANAFYRMIPRMYAAGVNTTQLQRIIDWSKLAWPSTVPANLWDTLAPDTVAPVVSITAPANNATFTKGTTIALTATATDNVAVLGVQFKVDGTNLSTEDTTYSYSRNWNTTSASLGSHTITAVARDAAGNTTTSTAITVILQ